LIFVVMFVVAWHLRVELVNRSIEILISNFLMSLIHKLTGLRLLIVLVIFLIIVFTCIILIRHYWRKRSFKYISIIKSKFIAIIQELGNTKFDTRLLAIIVFSIFIISFRFCTQWYVVRSMGLSVNIWQFTFAILFGILFSLVPIHGPAGFGTVEAPWVLALVYLNVPEKDAITSGFSLHIVVILFCSILGLFGAIGLRKK